MTIVVDSNLVAALALPVSYDALAVEAFNLWSRQGQWLIAPLLFEYELTSLVRKGVVIGQLRAERALPVLHQLQQSGVETIAPTLELHQLALRLSERIGQSKAYDAQYLALAARENAPFWTADRRLARAAQSAGLAWAHWIGELTTDHEFP